MRGRIAFFSPRDFGEIGTPGTYRIISEVSSYYEVRVFSPGPSKKSVYWNKGTPLIPVVSSPSPRTLKPVISVLEEFNPDIIYIFNSPTWAELVGYLKTNFPNAKIIFDIKTPLLITDLRQRIRIQNSNAEALQFVDKVLTHADSSVDTWFGFNVSKTHKLPPGIDFSAFPSRKETMGVGWTSASDKLRLIYAASLDEKRKTALLIEGFCKFLEYRQRKAILHIYGDGMERPHLEKQVENLGISRSVVFHGLVHQHELFRFMTNMDGAIGWVPRELYDKSPSLKVLEYAAAGLPILATATTAHREMEGDGFTLDFCEDTPESLAEGLSRWLVKGFTEERILQNRRAAEARDYPRLVRERLLPVFDDLLSKSRKDDVSQLRPKVTSRISYTGGDFTKTPLRVLITLNAYEENSEEIKQAIDLAEEMASESHCVYLAYQNSPALPKRLDESVVLFPYQDQKSLSILMEGGRFEIMVAFTSNHDELLLLARLSYHNCLPLAIHSRLTTKCVSSRESSGNMKSRARACWEYNLIIGSSTTLFLSSVQSFSSSQVGKKIEALLEKLTQSPCLKDDLLNYRHENNHERALHQRRMLGKARGE